MGKIEQELKTVLGLRPYRDLDDTFPDDPGKVAELQAKNVAAYVRSKLRELGEEIKSFKENCSDNDTTEVMAVLPYHIDAAVSRATGEEANTP